MAKNSLTKRKLPCRTTGMHDDIWQTHPICACVCCLLGGLEVELPKVGHHVEHVQTGPQPLRLAGSTRLRFWPWHLAPPPPCRRTSRSRTFLAHGLTLGHGHPLAHCRPTPFSHSETCVRGWPPTASHCPPALWMCADLAGCGVANIHQASSAKSTKAV